MIDRAGQIGARAGNKRAVTSYAEEPWLGRRQCDDTDASAKRSPRCRSRRPSAAHDNRFRVRLQSFADTKAGEDPLQEIFGVNLARDRSQLIQALPQFGGDPLLASPPIECSDRAF